MEDRARRAHAVAWSVLFVGALLYLARPIEPAILGSMDRAGLVPASDLVRVVRRLVCARIALPGWLHGAASDGAYAFALGALLADAVGWVVGAGLTVVLGHEFAQGLGLVHGTFDPFDLAILSLSFLAAQFTFRSSRPSTHRKNAS